jgi:hypothetical protein
MYLLDPFSDKRKRFGKIADDAMLYHGLKK